MPRNINVMHLRGAEVLRRRQVNGPVHACIQYVHRPYHQEQPEWRLGDCNVEGFVVGVKLMVCGIWTLHRSTELPQWETLKCREPLFVLAIFLALPHLLPGCSAPYSPRHWQTAQAGWHLPSKASGGYNFVTSLWVPNRASNRQPCVESV